jgi:hypothetical protein
MAVRKKLQTEFIEACEVFFKPMPEGTKSGKPWGDAFYTIVRYLYGPESGYGVNDLGDKITCPLDVGWDQLWEDLAGEGIDKVKIAYQEAKALEAKGKTLAERPLDPRGHLYS